MVMVAGFLIYPAQIVAIFLDMTQPESAQIVAFGTILMALAALSSALHWPAWMTRALLAVGGLLMLYGLYLGAYHAGVEWRWCAGPTDCAADSGTDSGKHQGSDGSPR